MTNWDLIQIVFNIIFVLAIYVFWVKLKRPPQDDPRLSRGLQLLQSKISVLEDLSDRTDVQFEQLGALMEKKCRQVQLKIEEAEKKRREIDQSMIKSMEVAEIFQDKIPHNEIIKRQDTIKYIRAAQMAYAGKTAVEISEEVDLPTSEIEMIVKVNKDELMFDTESLPAWAKSGVENSDDEQLSSSDQEIPSTGFDFLTAPKEKRADFDSLKKLGQEFREACDKYDEDFKKDTEAYEKLVEAPQQVIGAAKTMGQKAAQEVRSVGDKVFEEAKHVGDKVFEEARHMGGKVFEEAKNVGERVAIETKESSVKLSKASQNMADKLAKKLQSSIQIESVEPITEHKNSQVGAQKSLAQRLQQTGSLEKARGSKEGTQTSFELDKPSQKKVIKRVLFPKISDPKRDIEGR